MAVKDLINQISRNKIVSKAKELIDRDKSREGVQFVSPNLKQNISQGIENYFNQPRQQISASGLAYRTAKNIGQQVQQGTEALKARQESINQRTQGLSFLDRLKSPATQQENQQLLTGVKSAGIALAPTNLPFTLASMGLAGGFNSLQGQDPAQAMAQTAFTAPVSGQFIKVTNPLIKTALSKIKAPQIVQNRVTPAIANVAQGLGIDVATGQKTTPLSVGIDVLAGVAGKQGQFGDIANAKGITTRSKTVSNALNKEKEITKVINDLRTPKVMNDPVLGGENIQLAEKTWKEVFGKTRQLPKDVNQIVGELEDALSGAKTQKLMESEGIKLGFADESIPKEQLPLYQEAKKYGSAEEFIQDKVYSKFQAKNVNEGKTAYENFLKSRKGMKIDNPEKLINKYTFSNTNEKRETLRAIETYNNDNLKGYPEVDLINRIKSSYGEVIGNNVEQISKESKALKLTNIWNKANQPSGIAQLQSQIPGMGFAQQGKIKTNLTKAIKNNQPEQIIKTVQEAPKLKQKGFIKTVLASEKTTPELKEAVSKIDDQLYTPVKNVEQVANAQKIVNKSFDDAKKMVLEGKGNIEQNSAVGIELARRLQAEGRFDEAIEVIEKLDEQGRQSGRYIQSLSLWSRLTPEGMIRFAKNTFDKANERLTATSQVTLDEGLQKQIYDKMSQVQKMADSPEKTKATKEVLELINEKIPPSVNELFDAYRYQNMLSSPKTQLRNIYGNFFQAVVTRPATMGAEVVVDNVQALLRGKERTRYLSEVPEYYKSMFNMIPNGTEGFLESMKGQNIDIQKPDLGQLRTQRLPKQLTFVTRFMEGMDKFFQGVIGGAEYNRLIKSGLDKEEALRQSSQKAQELLFRAPVDPKNKSGQGVVLSSIDNASQAISDLGKKIPPVRWAVPFIQTPMNVFKQTLEFTPGVGLSTLIGSTRKNEQIAKQLVGSMFMAYGAKKAMDGDLTWSAPTDAKEKELFYASGKKPFSIRVGDTYVPIVYFGPLASAFILPAATKYYQEESKTALTDSQVDKLGKISLAMLEYLSGQTFLEGLGNVVDILKGDDMASVANSAAFTSTQLIPLNGLVRYINTILDPVYRKARGFKESVMSGIPGLSTQLEAYTDPNGNVSTRLPVNYVIPFDVGKAREEWELPLQQRQQLNQQRNLLNVAKKELEMGGTKKVKGITTGQEADLIREKVKYGMDVSEDELYSAYLNKPLSMKSTNKYEKSLRDSELYGKISDISSNEYLSEDQKNTLMEKIATELQIPKTELDYYQVANKTVDQKTMYVLDQVPRFTNENEFVNYLVEGRRKVNGQQLVSSGVIDNLVDEGLISESLGKQLKKVTFDKKTGKVGTGRAKKAKVITPPTFKVSTSRSKIEAPKIKAISGLKPSKYKLKQPKLQTDDIKIKIR